MKSITDKQRLKLDKDARALANMCFNDLPSEEVWEKLQAETNHYGSI